MTRKRWMIVGGIAGGFVLWLLLIPVFVAATIDEEAAIAPLKSQIEALTGQPLIMGEVSVGGTFSLRITIDQLAIRNVEQTSEPHIFRANALTMEFSLLDAITSEALTPSRVILDSPVISLERNLSGNPNWRALIQQSYTVPTGQPWHLEINNGQLRYQHHGEESRYEIGGLNGRLSQQSGLWAFSGEAALGEQTLATTVQCQVAPDRPLAQADLSCEASASGEGFSGSLEQRVVLAEDGVRLRGNLQLEAQDIRVWADAMGSQTDRTFANYVSEPLPLTLALENYYDPEQWVLNISRLSSPLMEGRISAQQKITGEDRSAELTLRSQLTRVDVDAIRRSLRASAGTPRDVLAVEGGIDPRLSGDIALQAQQVDWHGVTLRDVQLQGDLFAGSLTFNNGSAKLPGESFLIPRGILTTSADGLQFDGQMEVYGKSLVAMAGTVLPNDFARQFEDYRSRFNLIVTAKSAIFSELRFLSGQKRRIAGGWTVAFDKGGSINGAIVTEKINFDPLRKGWLQDASLWDNPEQLSPDHALRFNWLRTIETAARIQWTHSDYQLFDKPGSKWEMVMALEPDRLELNRLSLRHDGVNVSGDVVIENAATAERPFIRSRLSVSLLALGNAVRESAWRDVSAADPTQGAGVWSKEPIKLFPLAHYDGFHELRISRITHERFKAASARAVVKVNARQLSVEDFRATIWGGTLTGTMKLDVRTVPTMDIQLKLSEGQLREWFTSFTDYDNIAGSVSMVMGISTSGVNVSDWVRNAKGKWQFEARSAFVRFFNLPAIVRGIQSVRSVSSLANALRLALSGGATRLDSISGIFFFNEGKMGTTQAALRSNETVGEIDVTLDLMQWTQHAVVDFGLIALAQTNYPVLRMIFTGPIEQPNRRNDLKSIESYLAKKYR